MANARPFVHPPLPPGFCSNCFFPVTIKAPGGWLTSATVAEVVMLIKEAKGRMAAEFRRWAAGEWEEDPYLPALGYGTLFVSEWSRLGFEEVDFGWGKPKQVVPLTYSDLIPVCILGSTPVPEKGVRLSTHCVEEDHLRGFKEEMEKAWDVRYVDETWQSLDL
ncbi:hypothetical protein HPP92_001012 [Vanilla planifolia]|uniref:Uncharacterized protein n=1 Tax=Vanilla planifolia TaxID=51239 RepID=A0A835S5W4_VANPL|nr:hypothetical protein HPP92_001012 [Vanilla planifolia]